MTDELHILAAAYSLDALDESEREPFEAHLSSCDICIHEILAFRNTAAELAEAVATPAPPTLKPLVLEAIHGTAQLEVTYSKRFTTLRMLSIAAALLILAGLGTFLLSSTQDDTTRFAQVSTEPDSASALLVGTRAGSIEIVWSVDTGAFGVAGMNVPALDTDLTYELWFIKDGPPKRVGLLVASDGEIDFGGNLPEWPATWAITIEPAGGSDQPTSEIVYSVEVPPRS